MKDASNIRLSTSIHGSTPASWVIGGWIAAEATITVTSMVLGANLSTTALLGALGVVPGIVIVLLASGAPSPTVAQMLHAVETTDRRS